MTDLLLIRGGSVFDPAHGHAGTVRDLWIADGRLVADPGVPPTRTLDATGRVVFPGGVDMHAHIAGPKVNAARALTPYDRPPVPRTARTRSGTAGTVPSSFATGHLYAGLGYTTVVDAAIAPLAARAAHMEFADTPVIDKAFLALLGNHRFALEQIAAGEPERLRDFVAWTVDAAGAYGVKCVNPGGVALWLDERRHSTSLDQDLGQGSTPRRIVTMLADAVNALSLPHPLHVHGVNLGVAGNADTTLRTMHALDGRRVHLTHIQFHSYGGTLGDQTTFSSGVGPLVEWFDAHPELSIDVGQVLFGPATAMTGDSPLADFLHRATGRRWTTADTEMEGGCGIVPVEYREKSFVNAVQWAVGLEWFLRAKSLDRLALSTDHPNGAAFVAYPELAALLMSRDYRREVLARVPERVKQVTTLAELDREYSLSEFCTVTRLAPARILGMHDRGHLGIGAAGDVAIYTPGDDKRAMFALPYAVVKGGQIVAREGEFLSADIGTTLRVRPAVGDGFLAGYRPWFERHYSLPVEHYVAVQD